MVYHGVTKIPLPPLYMAESTNTKDEVHPHDVLIGYLSESCPLGISHICPTRKSPLFGHHSSLFGQDGWTWPCSFLLFYLP